MKTLLSILAVFMVFLGGCHSKKEVEVPIPQDIQLGTSVGVDKQISAPTNVFKPTDTVYVSVRNSAAAQNIKAVFSYNDKAIRTDSVTTHGPGYVEFHISQPSGLPEGNYKVVVSIDGDNKSPAIFDVKK